MANFLFFLSSMFKFSTLDPPFFFKEHYPYLDYAVYEKQSQRNDASDIIPRSCLSSNTAQHSTATILNKNCYLLRFRAFPKTNP